LYLGRDGLGPLACQFYRYGRNRARTIRKHPSSLSWRQLAVPALFLGLASPRRRQVLVAYVAIVLGRGALELTRDRRRCRRCLQPSPPCTRRGGLALCGASSAKWAARRPSAWTLRHCLARRHGPISRTALRRVRSDGRESLMGHTPLRGRSCRLNIATSVSRPLPPSRRNPMRMLAAPATPRPEASRAQPTRERGSAAWQ